MLLSLMAHSHIRRPLAGTGSYPRNGYRNQLGMGICPCVGPVRDRDPNPVPVSMYVNQPLGVIISEVTYCRLPNQCRHFNIEYADYLKTWINLKKVRIMTLRH